MFPLTYRCIDAMTLFLADHGEHHYPDLFRELKTRGHCVPAIMHAFARASDERLITTKVVGGGGRRNAWIDIAPRGREYVEGKLKPGPCEPKWLARHPRKYVR